MTEPRHQDDRIRALLADKMSVRVPPQLEQKIAARLVRRRIVTPFLAGGLALAAALLLVVGGLAAHNLVATVPASPSSPSVVPAPTGTAAPTANADPTSTPPQSATPNPTSVPLARGVALSGALAGQLAITQVTCDQSEIVSPHGRGPAYDAHWIQVFGMLNGHEVDLKIFNPAAPGEASIGWFQVVEVLPGQAVPGDPAYGPPDRGWTAQTPAGISGYSNRTGATLDLVVRPDAISSDPGSMTPTAPVAVRGLVRCG
jgi:hypothetical protein